MRPHRSKSASVLWALLLLSTPAAEAAPAADGSASCQACHAAQAAPQSRSRHALASGPGLWGQLPTSGPHVGASLACLQCHAPASDQAPWQPASLLMPDAGSGRTELEARTLALAEAKTVPNPHFDPHVRELGVGCTACHGQGAAISGPQVDARAPHAVNPWPSGDGASRCASCHQFGRDAAVNGKPPENLVAEWRDSRWGRAGASCVSCHMPDGRHLFQGIHDRELVGASVEVQWTSTAQFTGELALTNTGVGHDFPSYATPRAVLSVQPEDARGQPIGAPATLELGRKLRFEAGAWRELADTRVPSGETRALHYSLGPTTATQLHATVRVEPDFGYVALDGALLKAGGLPAERTAELTAALASAQASGYLIFDERRRASR